VLARTSVAQVDHLCRGAWLYFAPKELHHVQLSIVSLDRCHAKLHKVSAHHVFVGRCLLLDSHAMNLLDTSADLNVFPRVLTLYERLQFLNALDRVKHLLLRGHDLGVILTLFI